MASAHVPSTMDAVLINKTGGTEVLEYKIGLPVPQLKAGEVLLKNEFIGVNFIDTYFRKGLYAISNFPHILGSESAGTIAAVADSGDLYGLKVGDKVVVHSSATYATYVAIPAARAVKIPAGLSTADAAAVSLQAMTAWSLVHEAHPVKAGDWILVTAAAGGTGRWVVQMAKYLGANVIATCSTAKIGLVKELGADHVIDYSTEDYVKPVLDITGGNGVIAVFDSVGKATFDTSLQCVARKGTMVSFGNTTGTVDPVDIMRISAKSIKLVRPRISAYIATRQELEETAAAVFKFLERDSVKVDIYKTYPLKDAAQAQNDLESRKTTGKLLLKA